jgi:hypothetical protein
VTSGSQVGSGEVAGFPSVSARWIAHYLRRDGTPFPAAECRCFDLV